MKLACCGSSCGGKTTLATSLADRLGLPEAITYSRPTTAARRLGYSRASAVPPEEMRIFQWHALFEQLLAETMGSFGSSFVADRSVLDFAAYYLFQAPGAVWGDDYVAFAIDHACRAYDLLIHVPPPTWEVEDDDKRHLHGIHEVDGILAQLLGLRDLPDRTLHLKANTPEDRVEEVVTCLQDRGLL